VITDSIRDAKCDTYTQFVLWHSTLAIDCAPQKNAATNSVVSRV